MRTLALIGLVFALGLAIAPTCSVTGCALHHPVPVTPGWPDESPLAGSQDAGRE